MITQICLNCYHPKLTVYKHHKYRNHGWPARNLCLFYRHISIRIPCEAQGSRCRFRWWQPHHSGEDQDVWAIDDITLSDNLFNAITLNTSHPDEMKEDFMNLQGDEPRPYCGPEKAIRYCVDAVLVNVSNLNLADA